MIGPSSSSLGDVTQPGPIGSTGGSGEQPKTGDRPAVTATAQAALAAGAAAAAAAVVAGTHSFAIGEVPATGRERPSIVPGFETKTTFKRGELSDHSEIKLEQQDGSSPVLHKAIVKSENLWANGTPATGMQDKYRAEAKQPASREGLSDREQEQLQKILADVREAKASGRPLLKSMQEVTLPMARHLKEALKSEGYDFYCDESVLSKGKSNNLSGVIAPKEGVTQLPSSSERHVIVKLKPKSDEPALFVASIHNNDSDQQIPKSLDAIAADPDSREPGAQIIVGGDWNMDLNNPLCQAGLGNAVEARGFAGTLHAVNKNDGAYLEKEKRSYAGDGFLLLESKGVPSATRPAGSEGLADYVSLARQQSEKFNETRESLRTEMGSVPGDKLLDFFKGKFTEAKTQKELLDLLRALKDIAVDANRPTSKINAALRAAVAEKYPGLEGSLRSLDTAHQNLEVARQALKNAKESKAGEAELKEAEAKVSAREKELMDARLPVGEKLSEAATNFMNDISKHAEALIAEEGNSELFQQRIEVSGDKSSPRVDLVTTSTRIALAEILGLFRDSDGVKLKKGGGTEHYTTIHTPINKEAELLRGIARATASTLPEAHPCHRSQQEVQTSALLSLAFMTCFDLPESNVDEGFRKMVGLRDRTIQLSRVDRGETVEAGPVGAFMADASKVVQR